MLTNSEFLRKVSINAAIDKDPPLSCKIRSYGEKKGMHSKEKFSANTRDAVRITADHQFLYESNDEMIMVEFHQNK